MVWIFWSGVCAVLFLLMWPAFERDYLPPELHPFAQNKGKASTTPTAGPGSTLQSAYVLGWLLQPTVGGWLMSREALQGPERADGVILEPPRLYTNCVGHTWVEPRAELAVKPNEAVILRSRLAEQRHDFNATALRAISAAPATLNAALDGAASDAVLQVKLPYQEYGIHDMTFVLGGFKQARAAMYRACEELGGLPAPSN